MKTVYFDKQTQQTVIFSCNTDLMKVLKKKPTTFYKWSKLAIKETEDFILLFHCDEQKSRNMKGNKDGFKKNKNSEY